MAIKSFKDWQNDKSGGSSNTSSDSASSSFLPTYKDWADNNNEYASTTYNSFSQNRAQQATQRFKEQEQRRINSRYIATSKISDMVNNYITGFTGALRSGTFVNNAKAWNDQYKKITDYLNKYSKDLDPTAVTAMKAQLNNTWRLLGQQTSNLMPTANWLNNQPTQPTQPTQPYNVLANPNAPTQQVSPTAWKDALTPQKYNIPSPLERQTNEQKRDYYIGKGAPLNNYTPTELAMLKNLYEGRVQNQENTSKSYAPDQKRAESYNAPGMNDPVGNIDSNILKPYLRSDQIGTFKRLGSRTEQMDYLAEKGVSDSDIEDIMEQISQTSTPTVPDNNNPLRDEEAVARTQRNALNNVTREIGRREFQQKYVGNFTNDDFEEKSQYSPTGYDSSAFPTYNDDVTRNGDFLRGIKGLSDNDLKNMFYESVNGNQKAYDFLHYRAGANGEKVEYSNVFDQYGNGNEKYMTKDEIAMFNYLWAKDKEDGTNTAMEYYNELQSNELERRASEEITKEYEQWAKEDPFFANFATTLTKPFAAAASFPMQILDWATTGNINADKAQYAYLGGANTVRNTTAQMITDATGSEAWGDVFQGVMSTVDNVYGMALGGTISKALGITGEAAGKVTESVTLAIMTTDAAQTATLENIRNGMSEWEAILNGLAAGGIELLTEKIGMDNLFNSLWQGKGAWISWVKQALAEGGEEVLSNVLNDALGYVYDQLSGLDKSDWRREMNAYIIENNLLPGQESEAFDHVFRQHLIDAAKSGGMGALSGGLLGGGAIVNSAQSRFNNSAMMNDYGITNTPEMLQTLIDEGLSYGNDRGSTTQSKDVHKYAQQLSDRVNSGKEVSERQFQKLYQMLSEIQPVESTNADSYGYTSYTGDIGIRHEVARPEANAEDYVNPRLPSRSQLSASRIASEAWNVPDSEKATRASFVNEIANGYRNAGRNSMATAIQSMYVPGMDASAYVREMNDVYNNALEGKSAPFTTINRTTSLTNEMIQAAQLAARSDKERGIQAQTANVAQPQEEKITARIEDTLSPAAKAAFDAAISQVVADGGSEASAREAFNAVYNAGYLGMDYEQTKSVLNIPEETRTAIVEAAVKDKERITATLSNKGFVKVSSEDSGVVINDAITKALQSGEITQRTVDTINRFAKAVGTRVQFVAQDPLFNGNYNSKTANITLALDSVFFKNASTDAKVFGTFGHEFTHRLRDISPTTYNQLTKLVADAMGKEFNTYVQDALSKQKGLSLDNAQEEVVGDFIGSEFYKDMSFADKFLDNIKADTEEKRNLVQKLRDLVRKFINFIRGNRKDFPEADEAVRRLQMIENKLSDLIKESSRAVSRSDNVVAVTPEIKETLSDEGVDITDEGMVSKFSLKTWNATDINKLTKNLEKAGFKKEKIQKWIKDVNSVANIIAENTDRLDYIAAPNHKFLKANGDYYKKTLDASTLCAKRLLYQGTYDAIQHAMPNTPLTSDDVIRLRQLMKDMRKEVPCGICYVESQRKTLGRYASEWLNTYRADYIPTLDQVTTTDGLEALRTEHPDTYNDFIKAMKAKGVQSPKVVELRTEYRQDVANMVKSTVEYLNKIGGLRINSFSDFEIPHVIDFMQAVVDMSAKGLKGMAYTKVPAFGWIFGGTGIKINLSLIPKTDSNGNIMRDKQGRAMFDDIEGMPIEEALKIRDTYPDNVATIVVGKDMNHVLEMLDDDRVDFVIPFHHSKWSNAEFEQLGLKGFEDFATGHQDNKVYVSEYWDYSKTGKENAERYLEICAERNVTPVFEQLLEENEDGSYSLKKDGSTDGYWKLIVEGKMYNQLTGKGAEQRVVRPDFNMDKATEAMNSYTGDPNALPVAQDVVDRFVSEYKESHQNTKYSVRDESADTDYQAIVERNAQRNQIRVVYDVASEWRRNITKLDNRKLRAGTEKIVKQFGDVLNKDQTDKIVSRVNTLARDIVNNKSLQYGEITSRAEEIASDIVFQTLSAYDPEVRQNMEQNRTAAAAVDSITNLIMSNIVTTQTQQTATAMREVQRQIERNERLKDTLATVRAKRDENIAAMKEHQREIREAKKESRERTDLLKLMRRMQTIAKHAPEAQRVKIQELIGEYDTICKKLSAGKVQKLEQMYEWVQKRAETDPLNFNPDPALMKQLAVLNKSHIDGREEILGTYDTYAEAKARMEQYDEERANPTDAESADEARYKIRISQDSKTKQYKVVLTTGGITAAEMERITTALINIEHELREGKYTTNTQDRRTVTEQGRVAIEGIEQSRDNKVRHPKSIEALFEEVLRPDTMFARTVGFDRNNPFYKLAFGQDDVSLDTGYKESILYKMRANETYFRKYLDDKEFSKSIMGKNARAIEVNGRNQRGEMIKVKVTPDLLMAIYMHSQNEQNLKHICNTETYEQDKKSGEWRERINHAGGMTIPDFDLYRKGKVAEAYEVGNSKKITVTKGELSRLAGQLKPKEMEFIKAAQRYYSEMSQPEINRTSEALHGYSIATVDNYFRINTDSKYRAANLDTVAYDGAIESMGWTKERQNASNPILLISLTEQLVKDIDGHSKYVGMAIPIRNFNKVYGVTRNTYNEDGSIKDAYTSSVMEAIEGKYGKKANEYIAKLMADIQNPVGTKDFFGKLLSKVRSHYAGAVLTLNAGVAIKQAASYPTAAAEIGWMPLIRAMGAIRPVTGKMNMDLVYKYSPLMRLRTEGISTQELGEMKDQGRSIPKLLNWIQGMDVVTVKKLWKASEYYVRSNFKNLQRGTDAYYKKVGEIHSQVIEKTQPNYSTLHRPQLLRTNNELVKTLNMFKTQPFQNLNILMESFGELKAAQRANKINHTAENKEHLARARKRVAWAISSQVVSALVFALMQFAWDYARKKDDKYRNEEGELEFEQASKVIATNMGSSVFGMIPFGNTIFEVVEVATDKIASEIDPEAEPIFDAVFYGIDAGTATDSINDSLKGIINFLQNSVSLVMDLKKKSDATKDGEEYDIDWESYGRDAADDVIKVLQFAGIPSENAYKIANAMTGWTLEKVMGKGVGDYWTTRIMEGITTKNKKSLVEDLYNAKGTDEYEELYNTMTQEKKFGSDSKTPEEYIDDTLQEVFIKKTVHPKDGKASKQKLYDYMFEHKDTEEYQRVHDEALEFGFTEEDINEGVRKSFAADLIGIDSKDYSNGDLYSYMLDLRETDKSDYNDKYKKLTENGFGVDEITDGLKKSFGQRVTGIVEDYKTSDLYNYLYEQMITNSTQYSATLKDMADIGFAMDTVSEGVLKAYGQQLTGVSGDDFKVDAMWDFLYDLNKSNKSRYNTEIATVKKLGYDDEKISAKMKDAFGRSITGLSGDEYSSEALFTKLYSSRKGNFSSTVSEMKSAGFSEDSIKTGLKNAYEAQFTGIPYSEAKAEDMYAKMYELYKSNSSKFAQEYQNAINVGYTEKAIKDGIHKLMKAEYGVDNVKKLPHQFQAPEHTLPSWWTYKTEDKDEGAPKDSGYAAGSSWIGSVSYDNGELTVYENGMPYTYHGVPESVYEAFKSEGYRGKSFNNYINGKYPYN